MTDHPITPYRTSQRPTSRAQHEIDLAIECLYQARGELYFDSQEAFRSLARAANHSRFAVRLIELENLQDMTRRMKLGGE